jgi:transposase
MLFDYSVNKKKFKVYLDELRSRYFFDDICIYMDNLSVHRSIEIRERMDELGIAYIFSPIYSPDLNPVEYVFSMVKKQIKAERLNAIVNEKEIDLYSVIKDSFN